ncbi:acyl-CoA thioester hydrolase/BAAT C-terminal domain-containing protein [Blastomonas sp.]|uniref:acyl-CoA thioester hydrolase/BAAT C-terminal domain-containing protein n=1 Tax=Blastomonas sp. TaxID=1909299 RepID=UPI0026204C9C|nr:acyl-CoA thioester hydrolase/BAAT C-terminal domain-containing protein [Blastomonas sp.]MDM7957137.1 acyl-CoA thioester hydrolase/BAAT C-terminal domain-containing protein [Blastomonas sp.]
MRIWLLAITVVAAWCHGFAANAQDRPRFEEISIREAGIAARLYLAPAASSKAAAVLMLGGSDGGYPSAKAAMDLANAGHPVLALAYFSGFSEKIDGLPERLESVPLEYTYRALDWMKRRWGATRALTVIGESRGAELALLVASRRPEVDAIVAFSPSSVAWPAVGDMTGKIPAWTEGGLPVPFVDLPVADPSRQFSDGLGDEQRANAASIPVEQSKAAVLLVSSRSDGIWPASQMADRIVARLRSAGFRPPVLNLQYDDASHLLMGPGPGLVHFTQGTFSVHFGGSEEGTLRARESAWEQMKLFLAQL